MTMLANTTRLLTFDIGPEKVLHGLCLCLKGSQRKQTKSSFVLRGVLPQPHSLIPEALRWSRFRHNMSEFPQTMEQASRVCLKEKRMPVVNVFDWEKRGWRSGDSLGFPCARIIRSFDCASHEATFHCRPRLLGRQGRA